MYKIQKKKQGSNVWTDLLTFSSRDKAYHALKVLKRSQFSFDVNRPLSFKVVKCV